MNNTVISIDKKIVGWKVLDDKNRSNDFQDSPAVFQAHFRGREELNIPRYPCTLS